MHQGTRIRSTVKLLVADDERLFRQSLRKLLDSEQEFEVVAEAGDGQEAVVKAKETEPDIALLDVRMPKMDGIKAARLIRNLAPRTKILMLSIHEEDEMIIAALRAGASGYILKDADQSDFIHILRQAYLGKTHNSPYLADLAVSDHSSNSNVSRDDNKEAFKNRFALSEQELKVLLLLAEGLSNEEISKLVHLSRETIKMHLKTLFQKLQVRNRTEAAVLAVREGLF
jgi:two-component system, NarL family, response regulator DegU